jgi:hypothetical protein
VAARRNRSFKYNAVCRPKPRFFLIFIKCACEAVELPLNVSAGIPWLLEGRIRSMRRKQV